MLSLGVGREFDHIRAIARRLGARARGLGDDAVSLESRPGRLVISTDMSLEGVHFERQWLTHEEIGYRAAAGALSDLAAAAAEPEGILVSLAIPPDSGTLAEEVMAGAGAAVAALGGHVLGGDLCRAPLVILDVTAVGWAEEPSSRAGATPGDRLWVTGVLGGARAAVMAWQHGEQPEPECRSRFASPRPRIAEARWLTEHGARALIDLSDGLASDVGHLAARSGVATLVELERLPVEAGAREWADRQGESPGSFAARGGEDYELLAALPPEFGAARAHAFHAATGVMLTSVGTVSEGAGVRLTEGGVEQRLAGFDHFA